MVVELSHASPSGWFEVLNLGYATSPVLELLVNASKARVLAELVEEGKEILCIISIDCVATYALFITPSWQVRTQYLSTKGR